MDRDRMLHMTADNIEIPDIPEEGRFHGHWPEGRIMSVIVHIDRDTLRDAVHNNIIRDQSFHDAAPASPGFYTQTAQGPMKNASSDRYIHYAPRHFTPDADRTPAMRKRAIRNDHILTGNAFGPARGVITRFDRDTIIAAVNITTGDPYVGTRLRINTVRILRIIRLDDPHPMDVHVLAVDGMDRPGRRIGDRHAGDLHIPAPVKIDHFG